MISRELQAAGNWSFQLRDDVPDSIKRLLVERGHVVVTAEQVDHRRYDDAGMLAMSVYTGRLMRIGRSQISGDHITAWLGDGNGRGEIINTVQTFSATAWSTFFSSILPTSIVVGTINTNNPAAVSMTAFGTHPKDVIDQAALISGAEYRVNNDGTADSGVAADLYVSTPQALLVRKGIEFSPLLKVKSSPSMESDRDGSYWAAEAYVAGSGDFAAGGDDILIGQADLADIAKTNPYKNLQGVADTTGMIVNDPVTFAALGDIVAQVALGKASEVVDSITLDVENYDVEGDFSMGDQVWVYDPPLFVDPTVMVAYAGGYIQPKAVRVTAVDFPRTQTMSVFYRDKDGVYTDISPYLIAETGTTKITVGERYRSPFDSTDAQTGVLLASNNLPSNALTVPDVPAHTSTPWPSVSYLSGLGVEMAQITVSWSQPLNTDTTPITDGNHYQIRWRRSGETDYQYFSVEWGTTQTILQDLTIDTTYQISVAAFDHAGRTSGYGADETVTTASDGTAPGQPAAPTIAASALQLQVQHTLGLNTGGTFNLPLDLDHLNVYVDTKAAYKEITTIDIGTSTGGTWELVVGVDSVTGLAFDISAATLKTQAETLSTVDEVTVTGVGSVADPWILTFESPIGNLAVSGVGSLTGGDATLTVTETQAGQAFSPTPTELIGQIPADAANLVLGITVLGAFQIADAAERIVVVTAVDRAGNESTPSPEATSTADLIDTANIADLAVTNAKIQNLNVSKLLAGTIAAQEIILSNSASSILRSDNFVTKVSGWQILGNGVAEFNTVSLRGDLLGNWNGADPVNLATADGTATTGFALDSSVGSMQLEGDLWLGGDIVMETAGNGEIRTSDTTIAARIALVGGVSTPRIEFRVPSQVSPGSIEITQGLYAGASRWNVKTQSPSITGLARPNITLWTNDVGSIELNGVVEFQDGSAATPSVNLGASRRTGLYYSGTDILAFATAGVRRWYINAAGALVANSSTGTANRVLPSSGTAGSPGFGFLEDQDCGMFYTSTSGGRVNFANSGNNRLIVASTDVVPGVTNTQNCGNTTLRWLAIYAQTTTIQTSDERVKNSIETIPAALAGKVIDSIEPISFIFDEGKRKHWGFGAKQVRDGLKRAGLNPGEFGVYIDPHVKPNDDEKLDLKKSGPNMTPLGLRQGELIPVLWAEVQSLRKRLALLESA